MNIHTFINQGSGKGFHAVMANACLIKFGENPIKQHGSWSPTADPYANLLLDKFVGVTGRMYGCSVELRLFLRTLLAMELGNYLLTGVKNEKLTERILDNDMYFWAKGYGHNRLLLS
jgi:hypothetical protein